MQTKAKREADRRKVSRFKDAPNPFKPWTVEWYVHNAVYGRWEAGKWSKSIYAGLRQNAAGNLRKARRIDPALARAFWKQFHKHVGD